MARAVQLTATNEQTNVRNSVRGSCTKESVMVKEKTIIEIKGCDCDRKELQLFYDLSLDAVVLACVCV